jgi:hypothetical protein
MGAPPVDPPKPGRAVTGPGAGGRKIAPDQAARTVWVKVISQAQRRAAKSSTAIQASAAAPVCAASTEVPVTTVPSGKVKLHQVSAKGRSRRTAAIVIAATIASQSIEKPQTGTP